MQDYNEACHSAEVLFTVAEISVLRSIRSSLFYDRRERGSHGRALRFDVRGTCLVAGDRLEPSPQFPDVARIDKLSGDDLPVDLVFWRRTQHRVKHRNPVFNEAIGVTPLLLAADQLHCFNLGALQRFARELMWMLVWSGIWAERKGDQRGWIDLALMAMRGGLNAWEKQYAKENPAYKTTRIQKIIAGTIGLPRARALKIEAVETKMFFLLIRRSKKYGIGSIKETCGCNHRGLWRACCNRCQRCNGNYRKLK